MLKIIDKYKSSIRFFAVIITGALSILATIFANILCVGLMLEKSYDFAVIFIASISIICFGLLLFITLCMLVHSLLSYEGKVCIAKALRIPEAMTLLHETVTNKKIKTINHYLLKVYKTNFSLGADPVENVDCKEISGFHSWLFYWSEKVKYLGSEQICCNYEDIQNIIKENQEKWGNGKIDNETNNKEITRLNIEITKLQSEKNEFAGKYTAASGREARLQKKVNENISHITTLIKLTNHVTTKYSTHKKITKEQIKKEYLSIGKAYGITSMPNDFMDSFRESMPAELINWGGAPVQGKTSSSD